jgi:hypothetical protein
MLAGRGFRPARGVGPPDHRTVRLKYDPGKGFVEEEGG